MKLLAALLLLLLPTLSAALELPVRSGEHGSFTRLVVRLPQDTGWELQQDGQTARLVVQNPKVVFQSGAVFDRISTDRLAGLSQSAPGAPLVLRFNCDCTVAASRDNTLLILDIRPGSPPSKTGPSSLPQRSYRYAVEAKRPRTFPVGALSNPSVGRSSAKTEHTQKPKPRPQDASLPDLELASELSLAQLQLMEQVARAANRGVLSPKPRRTSDSADGEYPSAMKKPSLLKISTHEDLEDDAHIQIRSSSESSVSGCIPDHLVDVAGWSNGQSFQDGLGQLRAEMTTATGGVDATESLTLARFFIHFGFGLEARSILSNPAVESQEVIVARVIAQIVDTPSEHLSEGWRNQLACASDIALWAFLSGKQAPTAPNKDVSDAIMRTFAKLPKHLRLHLGPSLSQRFLSVGDDGRAANVLRSVDHKKKDPNAKIAHAQAEIAEYRGQPELAERNLDAAFKAQDENSPLALAKLVETHHRNGTRPDPGISALTSGYAKEFRGTDLGDRLESAHILALILEGDFEAALKGLAQDKSSNSETERRAAYSSLFSAVATQADDQGFLEIVTRELSTLAKEADADTVFQITERLLDLGFPAQAGKLLEQSRAGSRDTDTRLLRAKVALQLGKPNRALVELVGLEELDAQELKAEALLQAGSYAGAAIQFESLEDFGNAARANWLAGKSPATSEPQDGPFAKAADQASKLQPDTPISDDGSLQTAQSLLDSSAQARSDIQVLLNTIPNIEDR